MTKNDSKMLFVGLDVQADTISIAVASAGSRSKGRSVGTIPNQPKLLRKAMKKLGSAEDLRVCYEAGPTGYAVYWPTPVIPGPTSFSAGCVVRLVNITE